MTLQRKNWKGNILRIWITIIRHGGSGHEVQESWPYLKSTITRYLHDFPPGFFRCGQNCATRPYITNGLTLYLLRYR